MNIIKRNYALINIDTINNISYLMQLFSNRQSWPKHLNCYSFIESMSLLFRVHLYLSICIPCLFFKFY